MSKILAVASSETVNAFFLSLKNILQILNIANIKYRKYFMTHVKLRKL